GLFAGLGFQTGEQSEFDGHDEVLQKSVCVFWRLPCGRRRNGLYRRHAFRHSGTIDSFDTNHATMKIAVMALPGVFDTGLATILDALSTANELAPLQALASPPFEVCVVSPGKRVLSGQGLRVPVLAVQDCPAPDWVIV